VGAYELEAALGTSEAGGPYVSMSTGGGGAGGAGAGGARPPRNGHLAGQEHPKTAIPFDEKGYPDFKKAGVVKAEVKITLTGSRPGDFKAANKAAGFDRTPAGYTWHHHQDGTTMQLVPLELHGQTGHTGGFSLTRLR